MAACCPGPVSSRVRRPVWARRAVFNNRAEGDPTVGRVFWAGEWPGTLAGVSWSVGSGFPHASHLAAGRETPATPQNQEHVNFGFVQHQCVSDPWVAETGGWGEPGGGPGPPGLTGLGGSFWLRVLWTLPISVCELECDRPSKYGLGTRGQRESLSRTLSTPKVQPLPHGTAAAWEGPPPSRTTVWETISPGGRCLLVQHLLSSA